MYFGVNIVFGYAGQLTMFHGAAFGIGAYSTYLVMTRFGISFWLALLRCLGRETASRAFAVWPAAQEIRHNCTSDAVRLGLEVRRYGESAGSSAIRRRWALPRLW